MNEFEFLQRLRREAEDRAPAPGLVLGIGDDAAVFTSTVGHDVVTSTDLLVEDIDFRLESTTPEYLGHKALAVSLSDIAAMGARPKWALLSIGVPAHIWDSSFLEQFYKGFFGLADRYGVALVGGDLSRTKEKIVIDSIVLAECPSQRAIARGGAQVGDEIFVTGFLGDAAAGLRLLERGVRVHDNGGDHESRAADQLLLRQLRPEPRVGWGLLLGEKRLATSMIDLSDGLSSDLNHLCEESKVGAVVHSSWLPVDQVVKEICGRRALDPLMLALHGGEDFELLFTMNPSNVSQLPKRVDGIGVTRIGEITPADHGVKIAEGSRTWKLEPEGWKHFD